MLQACDNVFSMSTPIPFWTPRSKTEAVRRALAERRARLRLRVAAGARADRIRRFLEREIRSRVPPDQLGRAPDRTARERILGYGADGI